MLDLVAFIVQCFNSGELPKEWRQVLVATFCDLLSFAKTKLRTSNLNKSQVKTEQLHLFEQKITFIVPANLSDGTRQLSAVIVKWRHHAIVLLHLKK